MGVFLLGYDYASCIRNAERVCWRIDDVLPPDATLDLTRPLMPEALAAGTRVPGLEGLERLKLNQITGNAYVNVFAFVEEFIVAMALRHAQAELFRDRQAALTRFAEEELKHQELFRRYSRAFRRSFGFECQVLDSAAAAATAILAKDPLAVLLATLHLELTTQAHYTESVRADERVDPLFARLLRHHWLEEAQHAKLDVLEVNELASSATEEQLRRAFDDYFEIIDAFDALLGEQAAMDIESLATATGKDAGVELGGLLARAQHAAYRSTFLTMGMRNRLFSEVVGALSIDGARRVADRADALG